MYKDKFGQVYFDQDQVCDLLYQNPKLDISSLMLIDAQNFNNSNRKLHCDYSQLRTYQEPTITTVEFDQNNQNVWLMPQSYQTFDIESHVLNLCQTEQQRTRVQQELSLFQQTNLVNLLRYIKYMVDVMTKNNLVWGVGRGSSTASYVLYLLGLHNVDSLKYDIPIEEFFKQGGNNV